MSSEANSPKAGVGPLTTLYDASAGDELPLPARLAEFYGSLRLPPPHGSSYVIANLVTSLDGVVSLGIPGQAGGKEISGSNRQDRALMGLLRAAADAVVVGAGTFREGEGQPLTAQDVFPPWAAEYRELRALLNKAGDPLGVVVTASGDLDPELPIFNQGLRTLVVTTAKGAGRAQKTGLAKRAHVVKAKEGDKDSGSIPARAVLEAIRRERDESMVLVEGGPHLLGDFFAEGLIDEQFLTLSPQVVGRDQSGKRLALVEGQTFAPDDPLWGKLAAVKQGDSHLFLRYAFGSPEGKS